MARGNPANHTQRLIHSEDRVLLGAQNIYEARCRQCFDPTLSRSDEAKLSRADEAAKVAEAVPTKVEAR